MKLNQVIALEKGTKTRVYDAVTKIYQRHQKADLITGLARTYTPVDEIGETLPAETKLVQTRVSEDLKQVAALQAELFDATAARDWTNATDKARADVVVDGKALLTSVPVPFLLWMEKQLVDMRTIIAKLPTLSPNERWSWSDAENCFVTDPSESIKTKKVYRNHVKSEATDKHPAQVEVYTEDVKIGTWKKVEFSGALPAKQVAEMLARCENLQAAVKVAREEANLATAVEPKPGAVVFAYLFG